MNGVSTPFFDRLKPHNEARLKRALFEISLYTTP
jgi:hypothetical protein